MKLSKKDKFTPFEKFVFNQEEMLLPLGVIWMTSALILIFTFPKRISYPFLAIYLIIMCWFVFVLFYYRKKRLFERYLKNLMEG